MQYAVERYGHVRCFGASETHVESVNDAQYSYYDIHQQITEHRITKHLVIMMEENKLGVGTFLSFAHETSHICTHKQKGTSMEKAWQRGKEKKKREVRNNESRSVLYCTLLYCTVLYSAIWPLQSHGGEGR